MSAAPSPTRAPLAERLRPRTLDEVVGQSHLLGPGKPLRVAFETGRPHSMGGSTMSFAPAVADAYGVQTLEQSVAKLKQCIDRSDATGSFAGGIVLRAVLVAGAA